MRNRPIKIPGADHRITIGAANRQVSVQVAGREIAQSAAALALAEAGYAIAYYFPRKHVAMDRFARGTKKTWCPYKGEATHFDIDIDADVLENAAWSYEEPLDAVRQIKGYIAFYRHRSLDIREV